MEPAKELKRVLVAVRPEAVHTISEALGTEFEAVFCHTLEESEARLDETIDLILCGVHFDGGRMFDFLRYAKESSKTQSIPFLIVLGREKGYSAAILHSIQSAAHILGANKFVDLPKLKRELGVAQAYEMLRRSMNELMLI